MRLQCHRRVDWICTLGKQWNHEVVALHQSVVMVLRVDDSFVSEVSFADLLIFCRATCAFKVRLFRRSACNSSSTNPCFQCWPLMRHVSKSGQLRRNGLLRPTDGRYRLCQLLNVWLFCKQILLLCFMLQSCRQQIKFQLFRQTESLLLVRRKLPLATSRAVLPAICTPYVQSELGSL